MKKLFFIAIAAAVTLAACKKTEVNTPDQVINFKVANRVQTKATTGSEYTNGAFGTYAWFNGTNEFMVNEKVDKSGSEWTTVDHTFYWPKTGSIDFISYSPFNGTSDTPGTVPAVTANSIVYSGYTAADVDLMYADKVTCASESGVNLDEINDGIDSGFTGVPTLFRHALAKLAFKIRANFVEYDDPANGSHTEWEVTVNSAKISGFKTTGSCTLNWVSGAWEKPSVTVGSETYNVWTGLSGASANQELITTPVVLTTTAQDIAPANGFVMPQVLEDGAQILALDFHIKTTLSNGKTIEEDVTKTVDIKAISSLKAWQMNENIVYTISIKPTAKANGPSGQDDTPEDVVITFDPAVAEWTNVDASASIQL